MVDRTLTAGVEAAIAAGVVRPVLFFEGEYNDGGSPGFLRLFTGIGELSWDSKTWIGGHSMLGISPITESTTLQAIGFTATIAGLPTVNTALALLAMQKNRPGKLWIGFLDAAGALIPDPYPIRRGRFSACPIRRDIAAGTMDIQLTYEGPLARLLKANERRYTSQDQALRLAGDKGFDQVPELQDTTDRWGDSEWLQSMKLFDRIRVSQGTR